MSFMPTAWVAGLTGDLSSILWVPLSPLSHAATSLRVWMRPEAVAASQGEQALLVDRDLYRGLWHAQMLKVEELERRVAQYEATAAVSPGSQPTPMVAVDVLTRTASTGASALKINAGKRSGIAPGDVVVIPGDAIVGRISPEVGEISAFVTCLANPGIGRMDAIIVPASEERARRPKTIAVQLTPDAGMLRGDIDLSTAARAGDVVRLSDRTWPAGAQGLRLGVIREVRRKDSQPLRGEVIVEPAVDPATVSSLIVKLSTGARE